MYQKKGFDYTIYKSAPFNRRFPLIGKAIHKVEENIVKLGLLGNK
jgi:hypothetical protein